MRKSLLIALTAILAAAPPQPAGADAAADWQALVRAQKQAAAQEAADPAGAIATLYALFRERPVMDPWPAATAISGIVRLQRATGQEETAHHLCDWALQKYGWHPAAARTVADKALLLNADKRYAEVEALVAQYWPKVVEGHWLHANAVVAQWCAALQAQGKDVGQARALRKALLEIPGLLDEGQQYPPGWIYNRVANALGSKQEREEALRWARVRFLTCAFESAALERSARALARVWKAVQPADKGIAAFAAAQAPPAPRTRGEQVLAPPASRTRGEQVPAPPAPRTRGEQVPAPPAPRTRGEQAGSPLDAILPVEFDPALRKAQLARIQGGAQAAHDRISLHLLAGATGEALSEALSLLRGHPDLPAGTREVCRVLKAKDGDLRRANAFLAFAKSGAGANPLPALAAAAGTEVPPPPGPAARAALEKLSPLPEDLAAAAALRPDAETPAGTADLRLQIADLPDLALAEVNVAWTPRTPVGTVAAPAAAAPMPGLDAVAVPTLPAAVAPPNVVAIGAPPKAGSQPPTAPAAVPAGVVVVPPAAPPGAGVGVVGIPKVGIQAHTGTTPAPTPGRITNDVPVPPELWRVAVGLSEVTGPGAAGAAPQRVGIGVPVAAALPQQARVPESQPRPALSVAAPVAPVAAPVANAAGPAAVLVPAAPAASEAPAFTGMPAASPAGVPDRAAPAAAPVRRETPTVAVAGVGIPGTPATGPGSPVVPAPVPPVGVPDAVAGALVGTPAVSAGAESAAGTGSAPATVNAVHATGATGGAAAALARVAAGTVEATIALERIAADPSRAEDVWAEGQLTGDDLIRFLDSAPLKWEDTTCTAVAGILARHCADRIADTDTLSAKVRIWLGVHYRLAKDAGCIAAYESVLSEKGLPGYATEVALCGLAHHYMDMGQRDHAVEVWLREQDVSTDPCSIANGLVEAARLVRDEKRRDELYEQVPKYGYGWATGIAYSDQADRLIREGNHLKARELLQLPVVGRYSEQVAVILRSLLAYSYYRTGELDRAAEESRLAISGYKTLKTPLQNERLEEYLGKAYSILAWIQLWKGQHVLCVPGELRLVVRQGARGCARLALCSLRRMAFQAGCDSSDIRVRLDSEGDQKEFHFEQGITVDVLVNALRKSFQSELVIRSTERPSLVLRVPLRVEAYSEIGARP